MQFTDKQKKELEKRLLETVVSALENNKITDGDVPKIAHYVRSHINNIATNNDVNMFLSQLAFEWPIFSSLAIVESEKEDDKEEDVAIDNAEALIKQGNLDAALNVAKEATE